MFKYTGVARLEATLKGFEKTRKNLEMSIGEIDAEAKGKSVEISKLTGEYTALLGNKDKAERILGNLNKFLT